MDTGFDYKQASLGNSIGPGQKVTYGYDWVGDAYNANDETANEAFEDDDPWADCGQSYHGTHVSGTVGANPTEFGIVGVAPEASIELHRLFGCTGAVSEDVLIKASTKIYVSSVVL